MKGTKEKEIILITALVLVKSRKNQTTFEARFTQNFKDRSETFLK